MMYRRTTRAATFEELPPELRDHTLAHLERNHLPVPTEAGWTTHSEHLPATSFLAKLFGRRANVADPNHHTVSFVFLVSGHVLLATRGDHSGCGVHSALLSQTMIERLRDTAQAELMKGDDGIRITGFPDHEGRFRGSIMFGVGPGPEADGCEAALREACKAARAKL